MVVTSKIFLEGDSRSDFQILLKISITDCFYRLKESGKIFQTISEKPQTTEIIKNRG